MQARITELLKMPETIQAEDLKAISSEIERLPYAQSLRALLLMGTHRHNPDNYAKILSETAAFTTDKKILYQLINGKPAAATENGENLAPTEVSVVSDIPNNNVKQEQQSSPVVDNLPAEKPAEATGMIANQQVTNNFDIEAHPEMQKYRMPNPVYVNGELNRILFEGEEDFMSKPAPVIDLEATQESGKIVVAREDPNTNPQNSSKNAEAAQTDLSKELQQTMEQKVQEAGTKADVTEKVLQVEEVSGTEGPAENKENGMKSVAPDDVEEGVKDISENPENAAVITQSIPAENVETVATAAVQTTNDTVPDDIKSVGADDAEEQILDVKQSSESQAGAATVENANDVKINPVLSDLPKQNPVETLQNETEQKPLISNKTDGEKGESRPFETEAENSSLSYYQTEEFAANVKIEAPRVENSLPQPPKTDSKQSRHEAEMQKLLAEVEAKMKAAAAKTSSVENEISENNDLNFAETTSFEVADSSAIKSEEKPNSAVADAQPEISQQAPDAWKPMAFESQSSDSKIEVPSAISTDQNITEESIGAENNAPNIQNEENEESNVPKFINTWQNWLQLGGKNQQKTIETGGEAVPAEETKTAAIEKFIENEPKISRLNEEAIFTIRDRGDDISHLMTETFANLYVDQRLYARAIRAFEILAEKHPEKADRFNEKIRDIKEMRLR